MGNFSVPVTPPAVVEFTVGVSSRPSASVREGGVDAPSAAGCGATGCDREPERVLRGRGAGFSVQVTSPAAEEAMEFAAGVTKRGRGLGVASLASSI